MNTRTLLTFGLSSLVLGGSMVGCTATVRGIASAGTRDAGAGKVAAGDAGRARAALAKGDAGAAVLSAEAAVASMPQNAAYRSLLGQGYLKAGRFTSARAAFADALRLDPTDGRTALNLVLAEVATGDWQAARRTLDSHQSIIAPADRGLALALAGDPDSGAALLTQVVRGGGGTPTIRQNLALALALAGQWQSARVVASADMSPADVDRRMEQWAVFAKPTTASDQVASLLGVRSAEDPGLPVTLALTASVPIANAMVGSAPEPQSAPADAFLQAVPPAADPTPPATLPNALPLIRAQPHAIKVALRPSPVVLRPQPAAQPARGSWYVQVGAFRNAAVARDAWRYATRRMPSLGRHAPTQARFAAPSGAFYRLAFGGFSRADADQTCRRYRASGGACFVRAAAGDQIASWAPKPIQLASR